jgi:hypothetical protein
MTTSRDCEVSLTTDQPPFEDHHGFAQFIASQPILQDKRLDPCWLKEDKVCLYYLF